MSRVWSKPAMRARYFLDELGEMSLEVQKALLRFLDTRGEYQRLGDPKPRHADVQLVCASNARPR
jgi:transcriptional regulator with AAA-type ATPase domain